MVEVFRKVIAGRCSAGRMALEGAVVAVAPALSARATSLPQGSTALVLLGVFVAGLLSSLVATRAASASPLLASLKAD